VLRRGSIGRLSSTHPQLRRCEIRCERGATQRSSLFHSQLAKSMEAAAASSKAALRVGATQEKSGSKRGGGYQGDRAWSPKSTIKRRGGLVERVQLA
jgi:hypothetical protein